MGLRAAAAAARPAGEGVYRLDPKPLPRSHSLTYPDLATALPDCADGTEPRAGMLYVAN